MSLNKEIEPPYAFSRYFLMQDFSFFLSFFLSSLEACAEILVDYFQLMNTIDANINIYSTKILR